RTVVDEIAGGVDRRPAVQLQQAGVVGQPTQRAVAGGGARIGDKGIGAGDVKGSAVGDAGDAAGRKLDQRMTVQVEIAGHYRWRRRSDGERRLGGDGPAAAVEGDRAGVG